MSKKILQISPYGFDHPGGVEQYASILQEIFYDKAITLAGGKDFEILEPVRHCPLPRFWRKGFWKTWKHIQKENTSLILSHIRFAPTCWFAFFLAKKRGLPYIHIEHGSGFLVHKNPLISGVAKMMDLTIGKYIIRHADHVVCISEAGKKWVMETFGRKDDLSVIYRGFTFPQVKRSENTVKKIGFVGRLTGLKNVGGLIRALGEIQKKPWTCEIVGDGEERELLEKLVQTLGLTDRVSFLGAKPHDWIIRKFYPTVNIFVNPSLQEGLPTTVIEAIGMGCQVIATDVGGTHEISESILIGGTSSIDIQKRLEQVFENKTQAISLEKFSLEAMQQNYTKLFAHYEH